MLQELEQHWQAVVEALQAQPPDQPRTAQAALRYVYYWYNFMPLARGTAAVGYLTLLALFLAAGMPISARAPPVSDCFHAQPWFLDHLPPPVLRFGPSLTPSLEFWAWSWHAGACTCRPCWSLGCRLRLGGCAWGTACIW